MDEDEEGQMVYIRQWWSEREREKERGSDRERGRARAAHLNSRLAKLRWKRMDSATGLL